MIADRRCLGNQFNRRAEAASYLQSRLSVLVEDKRAIFQAAAHAQRAVSFLHSLQPDLEQRVAAARPVRSKPAVTNDGRRMSPADPIGNPDFSPFPSVLDQRPRQRSLDLNVEIGSGASVHLTIASILFCPREGPIADKQAS